MKKHIFIWGTLLVGFAMAFPLSALAHRVVVFAWVEQGRVFVEAGFGKDRPAKNCRVTAHGQSPSPLFEGETDDRGECGFPVPDNYDGDMRVEVNAGPGHKGAWTIEAVEFKTHGSLASGAGGSQGTEPAERVRPDALEKGTDPLKIVAGIAMIFGLALGAGWLKKRRASHE